jgi:hypothetical protein
VLHDHLAPLVHVTLFCNLSFSCSKICTRCLRACRVKQILRHAQTGGVYGRACFSPLLARGDSALPIAHPVVGPACTACKYMCKPLTMRCKAQDYHRGLVCQLQTRTEGRGKCACPSKASSIIEHANLFRWTRSRFRLAASSCRSEASPWAWKLIVSTHNTRSRQETECGEKPVAR